MNRAIKYRIYPNKKQRLLLNKTFGCCRKVWNLMLSDKIANHKATGKYDSNTPAFYKKDYPYLKEVDSLALANVQLNLNAAVSAHFDKNRKNRPAFPVYKTLRRSRKSYTTNNQKDTIAIKDGKIKLPKVKYIRAKIHRLPDPDWALKSATVSLDADGKYYVSVLFEIEDKDNSHPIDKNNSIVLDFRVKDLCICSDDISIGKPHFYAKTKKRLTHAQRVLSRRVGSRKGEAESNNRKKQRYKVAKLHAKMRNQRRDFLHKTSAAIAKRYDVVCIESLNIDELLVNDGPRRKSRNINRAVYDDGWYMFTTMLKYKLEGQGKQLIKVDKTYPSSETCSCCGKLHPEMKDIRRRRLICDCGLTIDRDINAAINIRREGLRLLSV